VKPGDAIYVHVSREAFLKACAELKEKWRKWQFTTVDLTYRTHLTITSGAGALTIPARASLPAAATLTARNFLKLYNNLPKTNAAELAIAFLPVQKQLVLGTTRAKASAVFTG
jgi:hypothetical protein